MRITIRVKYGGKPLHLATTAVLDEEGKHIILAGTTNTKGNFRGCFTTDKKKVMVRVRKVGILPFEIVMDVKPKMIARVIARYDSILAG